MVLCRLWSPKTLKFHCTMVVTSQKLVSATDCIFTVTSLVGNLKPYNHFKCCPCEIHLISNSNSFWTLFKTYCYQGRLTVYLVLDMSLPNLLKVCLSICHNCLWVSLQLVSILSLQINCFEVLLTLEALFNIADLVSSYK